MEQWAGQPVALSYRGVGSSTGKFEYLAGQTAFGCAELPVTAAEKNTITGRSVLHLPLVLGAMSAFHSIPATYTGTSGLELTPCMLAEIFSRTITMWNDPKLRQGGVNIHCRACTGQPAHRRVSSPQGFVYHKLLYKISS